MDTRRGLLLLVDYYTYYEKELYLEDAEKLIQGIPSFTLLKYLSGFNLQLYLKEYDPEIQFYLINSLLENQLEDIKQHYVSKIKKLGEENHVPIFFYRYSNYRFFDLVFKTFNSLEDRDLTIQEKKSFFDAYLIINSLVNQEINLESEDFKKAKQSGDFEPLIITNFMYQKDFDNNLDLTNQVMRGIGLLEFLNQHPIYSKYMLDFYKSKGSENHIQLIRSILCSIVLTNFTDNNPNIRVQVITILQEMNISTNLLDSLSINEFIPEYNKKGGIKLLWSKCLYKINETTYCVLDIIFFINQLYKSLVFEYSSFVKINYKDGNFLSNKAKAFSEEIYLKALIKRSFPYLVWYMGDNLKINKSEELCDVYLREDDKVILIEFKDVSLKDSPKIEKKVKNTFKEIDLKFFTNENGKSKGITQLANAIEYLSHNSLPSDPSAPKNLVIYPIVVYTDNTLGMDGINFLYRLKFRNIIQERGLSSNNIHDVIFINLSYLENHEQYFTERYFDIFDIFDKYNNHISNTKYEKTPFEIFCSHYLKSIDAPILSSSPYYNEIKKKIFLQ